MDTDFPCEGFVRKKGPLSGTALPNPMFMNSAALLLLERCEELPHALQAAIQLRFRGGVRNAYVIVGAEAFAGDGGNVSFAQ